MAVSAAQRLGRTPPATPLDPTRVHGAGRATSAEAPTAPGVHRPTGERREPRPDRHHVLWALLVAHHAGRPVRLPPRRGQSRAGPAWGPRGREPSARGPTTDGTPSLGAERARA